MYPTALGSYLVQQTLSGTGVFDGTEFGRAKCQVPEGVPPDPDAVVYVASKVYGAMANALTVALVDRGAGTTVPGTLVEQLGSVVQVTLQRDASLGLQARARDVAAAINAYAGPFPLRARYGGAGTGVMAATPAPVPLGDAVLGEDPAPGPAFAGTLPNVFRWTRPANTNGGLFYFENDVDLIVRQLEFRFVLASTVTLRIQRVNLDAGLEPIAAEKIPDFVFELTPAAPDVAVSDVRLLLHPFQAMLVECAAPGIARLDVARAGAFYLP